MRFWARFRNDLGIILKGFWEHVGRTLEVFWRDLGGQTMIRATKDNSRSTNHCNHSWIVGWDLEMLAFRWVAMVSCESQGFFFSLVFSRAFRSDFGVILEPQNDSKFEFFCDFIFKHVFLIVF